MDIAAFAWANAGWWEEEEKETRKEDGRRRGNRGSLIPAIDAVPVIRVMHRWADFPRHLSLHGGQLHDNMLG